MSYKNMKQLTKQELQSLFKEEESEYIEKCESLKNKDKIDLTPIFRTHLFMTLGASFLVFINHKLVLN